MTLYFVVLSNDVEKIRSCTKIAFTTHWAIWANTISYSTKRLQRFSSLANIVSPFWSMNRTYKTNNWFRIQAASFRQISQRFVRIRIKLWCHAYEYRKFWGHIAKVTKANGTKTYPNFVYFVKAIMILPIWNTACEKISSQVNKKKKGKRNTFQN